MNAIEGTQPAPQAPAVAPSPAAAGHPVVVHDPEHANLLALLLQGYLTQQVGDRRLAKKAARLRGSYGVAAGSMAVRIEFAPGAVTLYSGAEGRTRARVSGAMEEMIPLVLRGSFVLAAIAVLEGRIGIGGNPFALLGLLPLLLGRRKAPALPSSTQETAR